MQHEAIRSFHYISKMSPYHTCLLVLLYISTQNPSLVQSAPTNYAGCTVAVTTSQQLNLNEMRLQCGKIHFLEVQIPGKGEETAFHRIITDGYVQVMESFANAEHLTQCKIDRDSSVIRKFLTGFNSSNDKNESSTSGANTNATIDSLKAKLGNTHGITVNEIMETLLNIQYHVDWCSEMLAEGNLNIIQNGRESANSIRRSMNWNSKIDLKNGYGINKGSSKRHKRSVFYPGTKWCGPGNTASNDDDLGEERETDICCREHDHCPISIAAGETKYFYTNNLPYTISHDPCDEAFYHCLLGVGNTASKDVGNIYFNGLKAPSFTLKTWKFCFFGFCFSYEVAVTQEARVYPTS